MLGGIPSRPNRSRLLSKLYNKNLLSRGEWSFFSPHALDDIEWCRNALPEYSDSEYSAFLTSCERGVDTLYESAKNYSRAELSDLKESFDNQWCEDPSYIDTNIFASTSLSIISEGLAYAPANDFRYLTEKTWRTVLNRHPFIMAGYVEQSKYARSRGLRTFNQYLLIPDYDLIENDEQRMTAIVQNTEYFLNNAERYTDQICEDIEHNYRVFNDVTEYNRTVLENFTMEYQISEIQLAKWFDKKSFLHLLRALDAD
jgi:hypothetical protein